jgi:ATP-binding cassette subfamily B multidrug efflux pump
MANRMGTSARAAGATARRLAGEMRPQRALLSCVGICIAAYVVLSVYTPAKSAEVVNLILSQTREAAQSGRPFAVEGALRDSLVTLTLAYALTWVTYYLQAWLMASVAETLTFGLRKRIGEKICVLPLRFFDGNKPGEVLSRVTNDLDKVSETLQTGLLQFLQSVGTIVGVVVMMLVYSWRLTLVFMAFMLLSSVITARVARRSLRVASERQETLGRLSGVVEEYYTGRNVIRSFNHEAASAMVVLDANQANASVSQRADFLVNCVNPLVRMVGRLGMAAVAMIAGVQMMTGAMTVGVAQAFYQYMGLVAEPLTQASYMVNSMQAALASANRIFALLDEPEEEADDLHPQVVENARGHVRFDHVSFGYEPGETLMHDVSFEALPGQTVAIVGKTGAGKMTLVNLLMRFYEVDGGHITLDGVDTRRMTRAGLRQNFGMVLQDTWLFDGTVAENIAYGKPDATRDEIVSAAKAARCDFFVRTMSHGYDTRLSEEGASLSVGQRQLLTIARVLLVDPPVLILDEATSSVDTRTEAEIGRAMATLMKGRTSFVIAHRLSTIRDADMILVMDHGDIIEKGTHRELLAHGGAYASLYESQFS